MLLATHSPEFWQPKMSPDIDKCPLGSKSPPAENLLRFWEPFEWIAQYGAAFRKVMRPVVQHLGKQDLNGTWGLRGIGQRQGGWCSARSSRNRHPSVEWENGLGVRVRVRAFGSQGRKDAIAYDQWRKDQLWLEVGRSIFNENLEEKHSPLNQTSCTWSWTCAAQASA